MKNSREKHLLWFVFVFSSIFLLSAFWTPVTGKAWGWKWPATLNIGTGGTGTVAYAVAVGLGSKLEQATGMKVRVTPSMSWAEGLRNVKQGELDIIGVPMTEITQGFSLESPQYATETGGPFDLRLIWQFSTNPFGFIVRKDSDIKTIYDIRPEVKGPRKLSHLAGSASHTKGSKGLIYWLGLDADKDAMLVPFSSYPSCIRAVTEGKVDYAYTSPIARIAYELEGSPQGIRWLDLPVDEDPAGRKRYSAVRPAILFAPFTEGVKSAIGKRGVIAPMWYMTRADLDPELVYNLAKWFGENYENYKDVHIVAKYQMTMSSVRRTLDFVYLPVHIGTIRYFKEIKKWSEKDDIRQKYNADLISRYADAYEAVIAEAKKKGMKITPKNEDWLDLSRRRIGELPTIKAMLEIPK
jgi:TRAP transporter TAXI family solute receptor